MNLNNVRIFDNNYFLIIFNFLRLLALELVSSHYVHSKFSLIYRLANAFPINHETCHTMSLDY